MWVGQVKTGAWNYCLEGIKNDISKSILRSYFSGAMIIMADIMRAASNISDELQQIIDDLNRDVRLIDLYSKEELDEWAKRVDRKQAIKEGKVEGKAEGKAEAILKVQQANADGLRYIKEAGADQAVLTLKSLEAFSKAADGKATKIIIPSEIQGIAGLASSLKEVITEDEK